MGCGGDAQGGRGRERRKDKAMVEVREEAGARVEARAADGAVHEGTARESWARCGCGSREGWGKAMVPARVPLPACRR